MITRVRGNIALKQRRKILHGKLVTKDHVAYPTPLMDRRIDFKQEFSRTEVKFKTQYACL